MNIEKLNTEFEKLNLTEDKNSMERLKCCWKLIESDSDEFLELHLN